MAISSLSSRIIRASPERSGWSRGMFCHEVRQGVRQGAELAQNIIRKSAHGDYMGGKRGAFTHLNQLTNLV
jgi:hypothetical protein